MRDAACDVELRPDIGLDQVIEARQHLLQRPRDPVLGNDRMTASYRPRSEAIPDAFRN